MDWTQMIEFIRPELLILIPVLYLIGIAIKKTKALNDKYIPVLLGLAGIFLCLLYLGSQRPPGNMQEVLLFVFSSLTQGILTAGGSVYANQIKKQATKSE